MKHVRSLDALRGILSLFVVASHAWQVFSFPQTGETWANLVFGFAARAAVLCFFCLSGYVIAMSIHSNKRQNGGFSLARYGVSRIDRIVPPFLGVVLVTWLMATILAANGASEVGLKGAARAAFFADPAAQLLSLLTLTIQGQITGLTGGLVNGPVWSLVFEIQLYVIAGLIALAMASPPQVRALATILLVAYLVALGIHGLKLRTLTYIAFGFGSLAYVLRGIDKKYLVMALCAVAPVVAVTGYFASLHSIDRMDTAFPWLAFQVSTCAIFAVLVIVVSRSRLNVPFSKHSYTLYILHFPLFLFIYFFTYRYWPDVLARYATAFALAAVPCAVIAAAIVGRLESVRPAARLLRRARTTSTATTHRPV